jgi:hypothetical protein
MIEREQSGASLAAGGERVWISWQVFDAARTAALCHDLASLDQFNIFLQHDSFVC